jgi:hypothetical protein
MNPSGGGIESDTQEMDDRDQAAERARFDRDRTEGEDRKSNRETHADKQQPKEAGPGRPSRTRPRDHFDERS